MATLTTNYQLLAQKHLGNSYGDLYIRIYAKYSEQNIANNRTKVQYQARAYFSGNYIRDNQGSGGVSGTSASYASGSCTYPTKGETTIATTEAWVYHDSDGTKSVTASASLNFPNWGWSGTASATATLPTIPRQVTITNAPNFNDEDNPTITYSNPAGSAVTSLQACISLTGAKADVPYRDIQINGTSYTFELTDKEREILRLATTGSNSRTVIFFIKTVISETTLYDTSPKEFTIINGTPTLEPSVIDINEDTKALTGDPNILVRYQSDVAVGTGAQVYKSATVKSQKVICGNKSINAESGTIEDVGSGAFIFSVTDNRENTVTQTVNVPFIEYVNLTCNLNANAPDAEGDMIFLVSGNCFSGSFGAVDNSVKVYYRYKANRDEYGDWIEAENVALNIDNTYVVEVSLSGLDYQNKYTFQAKSSDALMEIASVEKVVKTIPVFDWGENDFNFNVPVNVNGDFSLNGTKMADYIIEQGTSGIWTYTKWNSGKVELTCKESRTVDIATANGSLYHSGNLYVTLPFTVYKARAWADCDDQNAWGSSTNMADTISSVGYRIWRAGAYTNYTWSTNILVKGRWKE